MNCLHRTQHQLDNAGRGNLSGGNVFLCVNSFRDTLLLSLRSQWLLTPWYVEGEDAFHDVQYIESCRIRIYPSPENQFGI
jgi:hypothetical protein